MVGMNKLKEAFIRFMSGRYGGNDKLGRLLMICYIAAIILNLFFRSLWLSGIALVLAVYYFFRAFSRNYPKRYAENQGYLKLESKVKAKFKLMKNRWRDRRTHVYRYCPFCKSVVRLPKKKGDHGVICPCCRREFRVKI